MHATSERTVLFHPSRMKFASGFRPPDSRAHSPKIPNSVLCDNHSTEMTYQAVA